MCQEGRYLRLFHGYGHTRDEEDPCLAADELALQDLMRTKMNGQNSCTHVNVEDSIPVCMEFDNDRWDESFLSHLGDDAYESS